jgi:integrase
LALIDTADYPQHRIVLALACNLALRGSEIADLRLGDLDLKGLTLRVRIEKTRDVDDMPINADLAAELSAWLSIYVPAARPHLNSTSYLAPSHYVHPQSGSITYRPGKPITQPHTIVQRALGELGWSDVKQEGVHTVRRSVARIFFDATEAETSFDNALLGTMSLLHHDRPETTLRYIGVDRQVQARNLFLRGKPFLSRLADGRNGKPGCSVLRVVR